MHFCITAQYTSQALNSIMDDPKTNRYEAVKKLVEAAGGKLVSMYSTASDGPGVLVIFDVPDPAAAPAIAGHRSGSRHRPQREAHASDDAGRSGQSSAKGS